MAALLSLLLGDQSVFTTNVIENDVEEVDVETAEEDTSDGSEDDSGGEDPFASIFANTDPLAIERRLRQDVQATISLNGAPFLPENTCHPYFNMVLSGWVAQVTLAVVTRMSWFVFDHVSASIIMRFEKHYIKEQRVVRMVLFNVLFRLLSLVLLTVIRTDVGHKWSQLINQLLAAASLVPRDPHADAAVGVAISWWAPTWHSTVGPVLVYTMVLYIATSSHVLELVWHVIGERLWNCVTRRTTPRSTMSLATILKMPLMQGELNATYSAVQWDGTFLLVDLLFLCSVSLVFGPALPVLHVTSCAGLGMAFLAQKFLAFRHKRGTVFDSSLGGFGAVESVEANVIGQLYGAGGLSVRCAVAAHLASCILVLGSMTQWSSSSSLSSSAASTGADAGGDTGSGGGNEPPTSSWNVLLHSTADAIGELTGFLHVGTDDDVDQSLVMTLGDTVANDLSSFFTWALLVIVATAVLETLLPPTLAVLRWALSGCRVCGRGLSSAGSKLCGRLKQLKSRRGRGCLARSAHLGVVGDDVTEPCRAVRVKPVPVKNNSKGEQGRGATSTVLDETFTKYVGVGVHHDHTHVESKLRPRNLFMEPRQRQHRLEAFIDRERDLLGAGTMVKGKKGVLHRRCLDFLWRGIVSIGKRLDFKVKNLIWAWFTRNLVPYEDAIEPSKYDRLDKTQHPVQKRPLFYKLRTMQVREGWRLHSYDDHTNPCIHQFLYKIWNADGEFAGVFHHRRQPKTTWEVIRDAPNLHSYQMQKNPKYKPEAEYLEEMLEMETKNNQEPEVDRTEAEAGRPLSPGGHT
jgi:hypothetical protein